MSIERALHQRWTTERQLTSLVPAERVFTGSARGDVPLPYVVLTRQGNTTRFRTSSGNAVDEVLVRVSLYTPDLDQGKRWAAEVRRRFDRSAFDLAEGRVLNMRLVDSAEKSHDDGTWELNLDFAVINLHSTSGV